MDVSPCGVEHVGEGAFPRLTVKLLQELVMNEVEVVECNRIRQLADSMYRILSNPKVLSHADRRDLENLLYLLRTEIRTGATKIEV
jgi:hypothetical protein